MEPAAHLPEVGEGQIALASREKPLLAQTIGHVESLHRLGDAALSELTLEVLLDEVLTRIQEILEVDTVAILLLDEAHEHLEPRATRGIEAHATSTPVLLGRGFAGRIAATRAPIFIPDVAHADVVNPALHASGITSLLGVPLVAEGVLLGVLHVGSLAPRAFDDQDAMVLQFAASRVGPAIERARLAEELTHQRQLTIALQHALLPSALPDVPQLDVAVRYLPARGEVGGDWYDILQLDERTIGFAIGDVVGHGMRAAALMGQLRTGLRAYALERHPPGETLRLLNVLLTTLPDEGMATALYGVLDVPTGTARLASAGHLPPVLSGPGGGRLVPMRNAPLLGVPHDSPFTETTVTLAGGTLLLCTDGLVERRDERIDVGLRRLMEAGAEQRDPHLLCDELAHRLVPADGAADDVAMLALRVTPAASGAWEYGMAAAGQDDAAIVRSVYAAFNRQDLPAVAAVIAPDAELFGGPTQHATGEESYRGQDGLRRYFADVASTWDSLTAHPEDVRASAGSVIVFGRLVSTMGGARSSRRMMWSWRLRDGLVTSLRVNELGPADD